MSTETKLRLLTRQQVAARLLVSTRTVDRLAARGTLVGATMGGARIVFREDDVERYIHKQFTRAAR